MSGFKVWVCEFNPWVWPFKVKLLSSITILHFFRLLLRRQYNYLLCFSYSTESARNVYEYRTILTFGYCTVPCARSSCYTCFLWSCWKGWKMLSWIINLLLDVSVCSIAVYFYELCPQGESKYKQRYFTPKHRNTETPKHLKRYMFWRLKSELMFGWKFRTVLVGQLPFKTVIQIFSSKSSQKWKLLCCFKDKGKRYSALESMLSKSRGKTRMKTWLFNFHLF